MLLNTRVKICGITNVGDAICASDAGADAIGLVFYPPSPRYISDLGLAREIAQSVGPFCTVVGLFVDASEDMVNSIVEQVPVNLLQFHGAEVQAYCTSFNRPFIKALRMKPSIVLDSEFKRFGAARGILLDSYVKGVPGGTGESFNWERIPAVHDNLILAGGLSTKNVVEAIASVKPYGVDVSGGVEASPGKKDRAQVKEFVRLAKSEQFSEQ